jgi:hypothetical protein
MVVAGWRNDATDRKRLDLDVLIRSQTLAVSHRPEETNVGQVRFSQSKI